MHLDYGPDISGGALFAFLESIGGQEFGMVLGKGGADTIVKALLGIIKEKNGEVLTDARVVKIITEKNRAIGVELSDGKRHLSKSIIANVNPALIPALLAEEIAKRPEVAEVKKLSSRSCHDDDSSCAE